ncbi:MAG: CooT family nickel-binding protein [Desulfobacteraceae bacterium]
MCLSTVYMETKGQTAKVLEDVARMEASEDGYLFIDLFGGETFVRGQLVRMDFIDSHAIVLKSP